METWVRHETVFEGRVFSIEAGEVRMDDGTVAEREVVRHPGGVAIVPIVNDTVILVRQFRIAIGKDILEIPAGKLEGDEEPELRARAELEEETGYRAGRLVSAGTVYASVGYTSEEIHLYFAFDLEKTRQRPEADECIQIVALPLAEVQARVADNTLKDGKTIVGVEAVLRHLGRA